MNKNLTLALCVAAVTVMMPIRHAWAQGGPAEAVAAGAAVATAVMTAIGGLSAWMNDQSDDVAAAVLAAAFGKHGLTQDEEKDTGFYWATVSARADDQHGKGSADASAYRKCLRRVGWFRGRPSGLGKNKSTPSAARRSPRKGICNGVGRRIREVDH